MLPSGDLERSALPSGVLRTEVAAAKGVAGIRPAAAFSLLKVDLARERKGVIGFIIVINLPA